MQISCLVRRCGVKCVRIPYFKDIKSPISRTLSLSLQGHCFPLQGHLSLCIPGNIIRSLHHKSVSTWAHTTNTHIALVCRSISALFQGHCKSDAINTCRWTVNTEKNWDCELDLLSSLSTILTDDGTMLTSFLGSKLGEDTLRQQVDTRLSFPNDAINRNRMKLCAITVVLGTAEVVCLLFPFRFSYFVSFFFSVVCLIWLA